MWFDVAEALARLTANDGRGNFPNIKGEPPRLAELAELAGGQAAIAQTAPLARADGLDPDSGAYLDHLRRHGCSTYGAVAVALGWGATRAWQAEAGLIEVGAARYGQHGRTYPVELDTAQLVRLTVRNQSNALTRL